MKKIKTQEIKIFTSSLRLFEVFYICTAQYGSQ